MEIKYKNIVLREMTERDIEDEVRWMTRETEWMKLDSPWEEFIPEDPEEIRRGTLEMLEKRRPGGVRSRLEIEFEGIHAGFVSSYFTEASPHRFLGIEICEPSLRGKGIGTAALEAFMDYYKGENEFFLETWSGNIPMIRCAEKLGFSEVGREKAAYNIDGELFDALTFGIRR